VSLPAIIIVDADRRALEAMEHDVRRRYDGQYEVVGTTSAHAALGVCDLRRQRGEQVALVLAVEEVAGVRGADLLADARAIHPDAGRALVTAKPEVEAAMLAHNQIGVHGYLLAPCAPPETKLYPVLDELLEDWRQRAAVPYVVVEAVMDTGEAVARIARDATLYDAAQTVAVTQVGDLMVIGEGDSFVGVLSEGDILRNALPRFDEIIDAGGTLHDAYQLFVKKAQTLAETPILPLVISEPIVLRPGDHVAQAATILVERQIRRLPVVQEGRLLGTLSRANICRAVVRGA
jgi:CBS domain-containing protein